MRIYSLPEGSSWATSDARAWITSITPIPNPMLYGAVYDIIIRVKWEFPSDVVSARDEEMLFIAFELERVDGGIFTPIPAWEVFYYEEWRNAPWEAPHGPPRVLAGNLGNFVAIDKQFDFSGEADFVLSIKPDVIGMPVGWREYKLYAQVWEKFYSITGGKWDYIEALDTPSVAFSVNISEGLPIASFDMSPKSGPTPLNVYFNNTSSAPDIAPITSVEWDFGDGSSSIEASPNHVYTSPGKYTVILTVTNQAGTDSCTKSVTVTAADPRPVFLLDQCWGPTKVNVSDYVKPVLWIENQGGAGTVFLDVLIEGQRRNIANISIQGYGTISYTVPQHDIVWYLGYTPTEDILPEIWFQTGYGDQVVSQWLWQPWVSVSGGGGGGDEEDISDQLKFGAAGLLAFGAGIFGYSLYKKRKR